MSVRLRRIAISSLLVLAGLAGGAGEAFGDYRAEVLADSPLQYYRLDDTTGSSPGNDFTVMADEIAGGGGFHDTVPAAQMSQPGALTGEALNRAINYHDTTTGDDYSFAGLPVTPLADYSLEFWVKTTQAGTGTAWHGGKGLVDAESSGVANDFGTALVASNKVAFGQGDGVGALGDVQITSTTTINDGAWHHIVATRQGVLMRLYVDGVKEAETFDGPAGARNGVANNSYAIAGINGPNVNGQLEGYMDEVALYGSALSSDAICRHYDTARPGASCAAPPPREILVLAYLDGGLGSGSVIGDDGLNCPEFSCGIRHFEGEVHEYVALAENGSRFSGFSGPDCLPNPGDPDRCTVLFDDPGGVELISGTFHLDPATLGGEMFETFGADAKVLEQALDGDVNPNKPKNIDFEPTGLQRCGCDIGFMKGGIATNIPTDQVHLIGSDGATILGNHGGAFTPSATSIPGAAKMVAAGSLNLIGSDGATLIGSDGATLIGNGGNTRSASRDGAVRPRAKFVTYLLGRYSANITAAGNVAVQFVPTKTGKKIMRTFGEMNAAREKPEALKSTYVELIRPADGRGTGGTYKKLIIK